MEQTKSSYGAGVVSQCSSPYGRPYMYGTAPLSFEDITFNLGYGSTSNRPEDGICSQAPP